MEERTYLVLTELQGNPPPQTTPPQEWVLRHIDVFLGFWTGLLFLTVLGVLYWVVTD